MKFRLVDKDCRAEVVSSEEQDENLAKLIFSLHEWFSMTEEVRIGLLARARDVGLKRLDGADKDGDLLRCAYQLQCKLDSLHRLAIAKKKQRLLVKARNPAEWARLRYETIAKRGNACECCGRKPPEVIIHVDHIKPVSKFPDRSLDPDNLQILCADCNLGKNAIDQTDWREK
jgi:5-methylcytosine-specific restriction endonuclease McrA